MCVRCEQIKTYVCNACNDDGCNHQEKSKCIATMPKNCVNFKAQCFSGTCTPNWKLQDESEEQG